MTSIPPRSGMLEYFGIRITSAEQDKLVGEIDVDQRHLNKGGIVHGGALFAFADDLGGTVAGLNVPKDFRTTTIESKSNIFHACPPGRLIGIAVPLHVGRRTMVVQTSIYRSDGSTRSVQQRRNWTTGQSTPHGLLASGASVTRTRKTRPAATARSSADIT
jgi:uncharacterized protein (TIGR00369 family)